MFEKELRDASYVPRWSIVRTVRPQSVADHSFYVAVYAAQIADAIDWDGPTGMLMKYALVHDLDEILSGDIAGPAKKIIKKSTGVSWYLVTNWLRQQMIKRMAWYEYWIDSDWQEDIEKIVKVADLIESVLFLRDEQMLGNVNVAQHKLYLINATLSAIKILPNITDEQMRLVLSSFYQASNDSTPSTLVTGDEEVK